MRILVSFFLRAEGIFEIRPWGVFEIQNPTEYETTGEISFLRDNNIRIDGRGKLTKNVVTDLFHFTHKTIVPAPHLRHWNKSSPYEATAV